MGPSTTAASLRMTGRGLKRAAGPLPASRSSLLLLGRPEGLSVAAVSARPSKQGDLDWGTAPDAQEVREACSHLLWVVAGPPIPAAQHTWKGGHRRFTPTACFPWSRMTAEGPRTPMSQQEESVLKKVLTVRPGGRRRCRRLASRARCLQGLGAPRCRFCCPADCPRCCSEEMAAGGGNRGRALSCGVHPPLNRRFWLARQLACRLPAPRAAAHPHQPHDFAAVLRAAQLTSLPRSPLRSRRRQAYTYVAVWIGLSGAVIMYNKYLLAYRGFPYPITLTMWCAQARCCCCRRRAASAAATFVGWQ